MRSAPGPYSNCSLAAVVSTRVNASYRTLAVDVGRLRTAAYGQPHFKTNPLKIGLYGFPLSRSDSQLRNGLNGLIG